MAERITLREFLAGTAVLTATGAERLLLSESVAGVAGNLGLSAEKLLFSEYAAAVLESAGSSHELLRFSELSRGAMDIRGTSSESLLFSEFGRSDLSGRSREALAFVEYASGRSLIIGSSREGLAFSEKLRGLLIETDDGVWVVNLKTGGHSRYIGDLSGGVPVEAYALTAVTDFGVPNQKHIYDAIHNMRCDGNVELATIVDEQTGAGVYTVESDGLVGLHRRSSGLARGVKGNNWQFRIANVDGSNFTHKGLEVLPIVSQRIGR